HELVSPQEREVLHRLAAFSGPFGMEQALSVAADGSLSPAQVAASVRRLVEVSLVAKATPLDGELRLRLIPPIHAFALTTSTAEGLEAARERHVLAYLELAERLAPRLLDAGELEALQALEADHDNLIAALGRLAERRRAVEALRLVGALWRLWFAHGHFEEGA